MVLEEIGERVIAYQTTQRLIDWHNELRKVFLVGIRECMQKANIDRFEYKGNLIILTSDSVRIISPESRKRQNPKTKIVVEVSPLEVIGNGTLD